MSRRAEGTIGSMVLLIAVLLTASIGAGVFIHVSSTAQQSALVTGSATSRTLGTSLQVYSVQLRDGVADLENLLVSVKLSTGSQPINVSGLFIQVITQNTTTSYVLGPVATVNATDENGTFAANYLERDGNTQEGALLRGDLLELHLQTARALVKDESVRIRIVPAGGIPTSVSFYMPSVLTAKHRLVYP